MSLPVVSRSRSRPIKSGTDSPSGLAADMRSVIRTKLIAGETDQQILDEFVASYGDSILSEPPKRGASLGIVKRSRKPTQGGVPGEGAASQGQDSYRQSTNRQAPHRHSSDRESSDREPRQRQ